MRAGRGGYHWPPRRSEPTFLASRAHRLDREFDTYFMIALPHYAALATGLKFSCQMQGEAIRKIINVLIVSRAPISHKLHFHRCEDVVRRSFDPSWLVHRPPKNRRRWKKYPLITASRRQKLGDINYPT